MLFVIVPYRAGKQPQRREQLQTFLEEMPRLLPGAYFAIAEQADDKGFNRGLLFNACIRELRLGISDTVCLHDVDLLPEGGLVGEYTRALLPHTARHIGHAALTTLPRYSATKVTTRSFGGVSLMHYSDYARVNGFPNDFWGWGGEDNVMGLRITRCHTPALAVERSVGTLRDLEGIHSHAEKMQQLRATQGMGRDVKAREQRYKRGSLYANGMVEAEYEVTSMIQNKNVSHYKIRCSARE
jgi:hypothetical protein